LKEAFDEKMMFGIRSFTAQLAIPAVHPYNNPIEADI
jgi:hypothetical protein